MSGTYKATGINLKAMPIGENDRLVTILTREHGLIRAIAPGARKSKSSMGGRSALFIVNDLLIFKGRSIDKITQAETILTYGKLSGDLGKLAASQYLAEIVLAQALKEHPQEDLYQLLLLHLGRLNGLDQGDNTASIAHLCQGIFHLLALGGIAPQVYSCCITRQATTPQVKDIITHNIQGLLGMLPSEGFGVQVTTDRDNLANLLGSAMMTGYFLRQMEQRMELEDMLMGSSSIEQE